jgi:hypothetical protein
MMPACEVCGQPAANVNRNGEHTGRHRDLEECLRAMGARIVALERLFPPSDPPATMAGRAGESRDEE